MIGEIKTFIFAWGSLTIFWGVALFLCCCGTEALFNLSKRKAFIGLFFFSIFYFLVSTYSVPRYFIYDHISSIKMNNTNYYPAVKNHLLFHSMRFQTFGMMSQDLSDFKAGDDLFLKFKVRPYKEYESIKGVKGYTSELLLLALLITWFFLINKLHNVSVASKIYKEALNKPTHTHYTSYLDASEPLKRFQPLKRRKAKKALKDIKTLYLSIVLQALRKYLSKGSIHNISILKSIISDIEQSKSNQPSIKVNIKLTDISSDTNIENFEKNAIYGRDYFIPSELQLSEAISKTIADTLNVFLPEKFFTNSSSNHDIEINSNIACAIEKSGLTVKGEEKLVIMKFGSGTFDDKLKANLHLYNDFYGLPKTVTKGNKDKSRLEVTNIIAKHYSQQLFTGGFSHDALVKNKELINQQLDALKDNSSDIFIKIYKECKSEVKGELTQAVIEKIIEKNRTEVDEFISSLYEFTTEHSDVFFDLISQELAFGVIENIVGDE
jgi:hypothetical protein